MIPVAQALIAFGGNVGDARGTIARAIAAFCDGTDVRLVKRSSDYLTAPWGVTDQPPFVNACILVESALSPRELLARGQMIERLHGRDRARETRWGPRPLDIDLIDYAGAAPDHDDFGSKRSKIMNVIDSNSLERDASGKPLRTFPHPALDEPDLTLPHPRALERAFVLVPLSEIVPDWRIGGTAVRDALAGLDAGGVRRLTDQM